MPLLTKLKPHQQAAVDRALDPSLKGLLLNHTVGSGKTVTSIAIADKLGKPTDVLVPASLKDNYLKEIKKHLRNGPPFRVQSYQAVLKDPYGLEGDTLIVDEAHNARNKKSRLHRIVKSTPHSKKILLTGTAMYNKPQDLMALTRMIMWPNHHTFSPSKFDKVLRGIPTIDPLAVKVPEKVLKASTRIYKKFKEETPKVLNKIIAENLPVGTPEELAVAVKVKDKLLEEMRIRRKFKDNIQEVFKETTNKYVDIYETPVDSKDYPKKIYKTVDIPMEGEQEKAYLEYHKKLPYLSKYDTTIPPTVFNNPFYVKTKLLSNVHEGISPKADTIVKAIADSKGKALVYSNFLEGGIRPVEERLKKNRIPYMVFTGKESKEKKREAVAAFNADQIKALLVSSAGAEGLDLKGTRHVHIMEPYWNNKRLEQVIGRAARYKSHEGLPKRDRDVTITNYISTTPSAYTVDAYTNRVATNKEKIIADVSGVIKNNGVFPEVVYPESLQIRPARTLLDIAKHRLMRTTRERAARGLKAYFTGDRFKTGKPLYTRVGAVLQGD